MVFRYQLGIALLLLGGVQLAAADTVTEDDVKLALIYKITRFVSWPGASSRSHFDLCLAGERTYGVATERLRGRKIRDRDIRVTLLARQAVDSQTHCDLVYVTQDEADRTHILMESFAGYPVLMVSDVPGFAEDGGMVGLSFVDGRVGMTINVAAYERAGLTIGSQLLELAHVIEVEQRAGR